MMAIIKTRTTTIIRAIHIAMIAAIRLRRRVRYADRVLRARYA